MLATKFRDDPREVLVMETLPLPRRPVVQLSLDALTASELDSLWGAVVILVQPRFTSIMDDPALPRLLDQFQELLRVQRAERQQIRAEVAS